MLTDVMSFMSYLKEYLVMFDNFSQNKTFFFLDIFSLNKNSRLYI